MIADPTLNLAAAAACFLGIHIFISGTRLRDGLVRMIGEGPYMGLFSLLSLGAIVWLAMAFNRASEETFTFLWAPAPWWHHFAMTAILVAAILVVLGNVTKSPTAAGGDAAVDVAAAGLGLGLGQALLRTLLGEPLGGGAGGEALGRRGRTGGFDSHGVVLRLRRAGFRRARSCRRP